MHIKPILLAFITFSALCAEAQKGEEINFSDPFQIDSSAYFLIPKLIDNDDKDAYGKGKGYLPWGDYRDVFIYNSETDQVKKVFGNTLAMIATFSPRRYSYYSEKPSETPANILPAHIVYLARTEDFNKDKAIDTEDPVYLYISTKTGDALTQITPRELNVVSWTISKDKKTILVKLQQDTSGNKKFGNGDHQVYYRILLDNDVSKIRCYPIAL